MTDAHEEDERYHIPGIHSLEDTIEYIMNHQQQTMDNPEFMRMSIKHRQLIDLIDMGCIKKHAEDRYEFVYLTRKALDMIAYASMSWPTYKRIRVFCQPKKQ